MLILIVALACSLAVTLVAVRWARGDGLRSLDSNLEGPQKFHVRPVSRVGGIGIVVGVAAGMLTLIGPDREYRTGAFLLLLAASPAFAAGLVEDINKNVSPRRRLVSAAVSALLAVWLLDSTIERTAIPGLDWVVSFPLGAALVTAFVVAGVANAVNIIDGFNGLASMCVIMILMSLAYVGFSVGDRFVAVMALAGVGAVLGFFMLNFPAGLIFLGDGGAYFLGFYVAELAILLLHRNAQVSPMFPLLLCIYPVFETLFSIYRRKLLTGRPAGMPDGAHLHSLIYRRFLRWAAGERTARELTRRNSMTSPYLWILCMSSVVPAVLWWDNTAVLAVFIVLFGVGYTYLYWRIVRFKSPRWLVARRRRRYQG
jgi:UDP-N-acetylmuramyl pentapeptide phosphotransferase/UDP-N-acetylglucosamine-1-phosphate transferase